jgi:plastocyanin domain-containing protein
MNMDTAEVIITAGGALLVASILWFFFGPRKATAARRASGGGQEITVTVRGAYSPDRIEVEAGHPLRLNFVREEENPCTAQVIFPDFGVVKDLPVGKPVPVEFTPEKPGEYQFHCGMSMVRGRLIVTPPARGGEPARIDG